MYKLVLYALALYVAGSVTGYALSRLIPPQSAWYRRRRRLEVYSTIRGPGDPLYRYVDPETGRIYVGSSRWGLLVPSIKNQEDTP